MDEQLIRKTMDAIRPNGAFVLNIGNRVYPLDKILFDEFNTTYNIVPLVSFLSPGMRPRSNKGCEMFFEITKQ